MPQPSVASSRITHSLLYLSLQLEVPSSATAICSIFKDHTQSVIFISAVRGRAVDKREYVMIIFHIFSSKPQHIFLCRINKNYP